MSKEDDESTTIANPSVCLACKYMKHIKTGIADHVYCTKNGSIDESNNPFAAMAEEDRPVGMALATLDHKNFIGIAHLLWDSKICKEKTTVTLNPDFQIPENCDYKFEHMLAGTEEGIDKEDEEDNG